MDDKKIVGALFILSVASALALAVLLWSAWWLLPVYGVVLYPLGAPAVDYWHLAALLYVVSIATYHSQGHDRVKETDSEKTGPESLKMLAFSFLRPVVAYYVIGWLLS